MKEKRTKTRNAVTRREFLKYTTFVSSAVAINGFPAIIQSAPKEVEVVGMWPLTGPASGWGIRDVQGEQMVYDEYNKAGGIKALEGAKIKYTVVDTETKIDVAANRAEKVVAGDAVAITGTSQSAASLVVSQVTERGGIPFIVPVDIDPLITERGLKYTFRPATMITDIAREAMEFAASMSRATTTKVKTVGILCEDSVLGVTASATFKKLSQEKGWEVVDIIHYNAATAKDFTGMISRFKNAGTDIFLGVQKPPDALLIARTCIEMDFNPVMIAGAAGGWTSVQFSQAMKDQADFITVAQPFSPDMNLPDLQEFRKRYMARYKEDLEWGTAGGAGSAYLVIKALESAGSTDRKAIRDALANIDIKIGGYWFLLDGCKFNEKGDNVKAGALVTQYKGGSLHSVYPQQFATMKPVWPKPKWKK